MSRFGLFVVAWALVGGLVALYVITGWIGDVATRLLDRRRARVVQVIGVVLFESDRDAEAVHEAVADLPRRMLLRVLQNLAVDLDGVALQRVRQLVRTTGLERFIRRRSRARRWRLRVQAAQLHHLVANPDFDRRRLLVDRHPLVRARAAEALTAEHAVLHLDVLMPMLAADDAVVRMAAQQAVLKAGADAVPLLIDQLVAGIVDSNAALEVVANLPDPRFIPVLTAHAESDDHRTRMLVAKALGNGASSSVPLLHVMLGDVDETVRATAIDSLARLDAVTSVNVVGERLSDRSFLVRRAAGLALDQLGPAGRLALRRHLEHPDRFAADMARQVLDSASARLGVNLLPVGDDVLIDLGESDAYATIEVARPLDVTSYRAATPLDVSRYSEEQIRSTVHTEANRALAAVSDAATSGPLTRNELTDAMFFAITAADVIDALLAPVEAHP